MDLLHRRDCRGNCERMVSIGDAGTGDGIVLTGIPAGYLA
jgi:uncharacterized membrane protein